ncbi:hypothetical protein NW767_010406 [Fusarium falciforme]|nr:hypothetical protein NW767_010406 [Fusarium falciforme]
MGKRASFREGEESSPRSFRDKWRSIPRPTIRWTKPGPREQYDVDEQQPVAVHEIASPEHRTETDATRDQQPINLAVSQEQASGQARSQGVELSAQNQVAELTAESSRV